MASESVTEAGREGWAELEAGRTLDALIAERVMGWELTHRGHRVMTGLDDPCGRGRREIRGFAGASDARRWIGKVCPDYSTDISAAWGVVEKLAAEGPEWPHHGHFVGLHNSTGEGRWECRIGATAVAHADTAPLAICRAALKAHAAPHAQPSVEPRATQEEA